MTEDINPYEDQLCEVCSYSIDNHGYCVMDLGHVTPTEDSTSEVGHT